MSCYNLGVDASPAMVAATQRQADERRLPVVSIAGNAEQLPLPDASYDLAWRRRATAQLPAGRARDKALSFRPRVSGAGSVSDRGVLRSRRRVPVSVDGCGAEVLRYRGYADVERPDTQDCNFVLGDGKGREVDVHTYTFDSDGNHVYGIPYPAASLTGTGVINGHAVRCISLEGLLNFREKYTPDAGDIADIQRVCDRFGVPPPRNYTGLMPT